MDLFKMFFKKKLDLCRFVMKKLVDVNLPHIYGFVDMKFGRRNLKNIDLCDRI